MELIQLEEVLNVPNSASSSQLKVIFVLQNKCHNQINDQGRTQGKK